MPTMEELQKLYYEDYSDQDSSDFDYLSYTPVGGSTKVEKIEDDLEEQVSEIYRQFGRKTRIRVYK